MKVTLIHNPGAGSVARCTVGQLEALIEEAGHRVRTRSTKEKGWSKILKKKADLVAVAGGDGTVGKVARRLAHRRVPIAVLPMGTANNISKSLGLNGHEITQLIPAWSDSRRLKFDSGCAIGPWGERRFIEGVGMGLFPRLIAEMSRNRTIRHLSDPEVKVTYTLQVLRDKLEAMRAMRINALLDGQDISGEYLMFEALNTRYIGPNLFLAPAGVPNSGLLDLAFVKERDRRKFARYLETWQAGMMWPHEFGVARGKRLEIEWTGFPVHLDDKLWPRRGEAKPAPPGLIEIEMERGALEFLVPAQPRAKSRRK